MSNPNRGWTKGPDSHELYVEAMEAKAQSELAPARCSATPEQWWSKRASEIAAQMKAGGVAELRITRCQNGKYEFEITPEEWSN